MNGRNHVSRLSNTVGSQRLLQVAVNERSALLDAALRRSGALGPSETIRWVSPLRDDGYKEFRDATALTHLGIAARLREPLSDFWPARGPVWDALGVSSGAASILVEAKAHIPEAASPPSQATPDSLAKIRKSLDTVRAAMAPRSRADWSRVFYQYANRLAFQWFLTRVNGLGSRLVFLNFINATDVNGPETEEEWHGATRLIHAVLGLPADLRQFGVFHAILDAKQLGVRK